MSESSVKNKSVRGHLTKWIIIVAAVAALILGYIVMNDWDSFLDGLHGRPESGNP